MDGDIDQEQTRELYRKNEEQCENGRVNRNTQLEGHKEREGRRNRNIHNINTQS